MRAPILALKDVRLADGPLMLFDGVNLGLEPRVRRDLQIVQVFGTAPDRIILLRPR